jgi:hypothetical protein
MTEELMERKPAETFLAHILRGVKGEVDDRDGERGAVVFVIPLGAMQEPPYGGTHLADLFLRDLYLSDEFNFTEVI